MRQCDLSRRVGVVAGGLFLVVGCLSFSTANGQNRGSSRGPAFARSLSAASGARASGAARSNSGTRGARVQPRRARQGRVAPGRVAQGRVGQGRVGQGRAEQGRVAPGPGVGRGVQGNPGMRGGNPSRGGRRSGYRGGGYRRGGGRYDNRRRTSVGVGFFYDYPGYSRYRYPVYGGYPGYGVPAYGVYPGYTRYGYYRALPTDLTYGQQVIVAPRQTVLPAEVTSVPATAGIGDSSQPVISCAPSASAYQFRAERALRQNQIEQAVRESRHAVIEDPENGRLQLFTSQVLFAAGHYRQSVDALGIATELLEASDWGYVVENFKQFYRGHHYVVQMQQLDEYLEQNPNQGFAYTLRGYHFKYLGYPEAAEKQLALALELNTDDRLAARLLDDIGPPLPAPDAARPADDLAAPFDDAAPSADGPATQAELPPPLPAPDLEK